jgi:Gpi18-like mannosyltransferase
MNVSRQRWLPRASAVLAATAFIVRLTFIHYSNGDMERYNLLWYDKLATDGILHTLGTNFSNYTPPYTYLVALATLTNGIFSPLTALKLIPICFDILNACIVFFIIRIKYPHGNIPAFAAAIFFSAPTVMLNSAYWGQADSIYTTFLLLCLHASLRGKSLEAITWFAVAFSIKAQAVFLFPFLLIMTPGMREFLLSLLIIPGVYLIAVLPTILLGRPLMDVLFIYANQAGTFRDLSMNAPNLYVFLPNDWYDLVYPAGMLLALTVILLWLRARKNEGPHITQDMIVTCAATSVLLVPFLLPKMHDRYFYPADVFAIVLAFYRPSLWHIATLLQFSSTMAYTRFLLRSDLTWLWIAAVENTVVLGLLLRRQGLKALPA